MFHHFSAAEARIALPLRTMEGRIAARKWAKEGDGVWVFDRNIEEGEFYGRPDIVKLVLTAGVKTIGSEAFRSCTDLTSVTFPKGLTSIGSQAFFACTGLTSLTLPQGLTSIGSEAFALCTGLTSVTLPEGLEKIDDLAFYECTGLTSVTLPQGLEKIGELSFQGCTGLTSVTFPEGLQSIGDSAFALCTGLTSLTFPEGLEKIGDLAFEGCTGLTSVTFPEGLTSIGWASFCYCSNLRYALIPDSVSGIERNVFQGCPSVHVYCSDDARPLFGLHISADRIHTEVHTCLSTYLEVLKERLNLQRSVVDGVPTTGGVTRAETKTNIGTRLLEAVGGLELTSRLKKAHDGLKAAVEAVPDEQSKEALKAYVNRRLKVAKYHGKHMTLETNPLQGPEGALWKLYAPPEINFI